MEFLELMKYTLPSLIVFVATYMVMRSFMEREERKRKFDITTNNSKLITPIKLQAYERVVLFLERISPDSLIVRVQQPGMSARELHNDLLNNIRAEYEHNLSQQIYVSGATWTAVKSAKESIVKLINSAASRLDPEAKSIDLSKLVIEMYVSVEESPTGEAIDIAKTEIQNIL